MTGHTRFVLNVKERLWKLSRLSLDALKKNGLTYSLPLCSVNSVILLDSRVYIHTVTFTKQLGGSVFTRFIPSIQMPVGRITRKSELIV